MKHVAVLVAVSCVLLAGCGTTRPTAPPEALDCRLKDFRKDDIFTDRNRYLRSVIKAQALGDREPSFNVLSLSAGGEFGAYGAGFLVGWGSVGDKAKPSPRKDIQVVTGVSTGAILATHAFLGLDEEIQAKYESLSGEQIYRRRSEIEYLWSDSLFDTSGKDKLIEANLTSQIIDQVAEEHRTGNGRFLYIGIVNIDTGEFWRIDIGALASTLPQPVRDVCYRAVIGASSAIPVAFAPKFIDDAMWVDGGARHHLFVTEVPMEAMLPNVTRRLYSLVHGNLSAGATRVDNGVLQIAGRTAELFVDQGVKDSIRLQHELASTCPKGADCGPSNSLFQVRYAAAAEAAQRCSDELKKCTTGGSSTSGDKFCKPFMVCLAREGRADGKRAAANDAWLAIEDLCLGSNPDCPKKQPQIRQLFQ